MLAGWLDRVLVPGVAYRLKTAEGEPEGLLSMHTALILNTSDTPPDREANVLGDPLQLIWVNCVLPYCGVKMEYCGQTAHPRDVPRINCWWCALVD